MGFNPRVNKAADGIGGHYLLITMAITRKSILVACASIAFIAYLVITLVTASNQIEVNNKIVAQLKAKYPKKVIFDTSVPGKIILLGDIDPADFDQISKTLQPSVLILSDTTIAKGLIDSLNENTKLKYLDIIQPLTLPAIDLSQALSLTDFQISFRDQVVDLSQVHLSSRVENIRLHGFHPQKFDSQNFWASKHYQEISFRFSKIGNTELLKLMDFFQKNGITVEHLVVSDTEVTLTENDLQKYAAVVKRISNVR